MKSTTPNIDSDKIIIRDYRPGDESGISLLFNTSDPRHGRNALYWKWSNSNSINGDFLAVVAEYNGEIIAHYSIMGRDVHYNNETWRIGFGQQAVVHKNARNLNVICSLSKHIFAKARGRYKFLYAFPNDIFFLVKTTLLGWKKVGIFNTDIIDIENLDVGSNQRVIIKKVYQLDDSVQRILDNRKQGFIHFAKTSQFLNWRFLNHPLNQYLVYGAYSDNILIGYIVLKTYYNDATGQLIGHFLDYGLKDHDIEILNCLLLESKKLFLFNNINKIVFWNRDVEYNDLLKKFTSGNNGGFSTNFALLMLDNNCQVPLDMQYWSFSMADSDAF